MTKIRVASPPSLGVSAKRLEQSHPYLSDQLLKSESLRDARLAHYANDVRLAAYEQLQTHLEGVWRDFQKHEVLIELAFLAWRAKGDFETCLESTLSGYPAVAQDSMRDVMEIEFLLREFFFEPNHIGDWLACSDKERHERFRPALLRQRYAKRLGKQPQDLGEAADYKGHSMFLHVSPRANPFGGPGLVVDVSPSGADGGFWEMFAHARSIVHAFYFLRKKIAPKLKASVQAPRSLTLLRRAWEQTQRTQMLWLAAMQVMAEHAEEAEALRTAPQGGPPSASS
jgi:hypothetical protein